MTTQLEAANQRTEKLQRELEVANLQTDAAIAVIPLIYQYVDGYGPRHVVVADIVRCWADLDPSVRKHYECRSIRTTPIGHFAGEYAEAVMTPCEDEPPVTAADFEEMEGLDWAAHITAVRRRNILRQQPTEWLAQFPTNKTPTWLEASTLAAEAPAVVGGEHQ